MTLDLIDDNYFAVITTDGPFAGHAVDDYVDLSTLLRNIAVAGALERARGEGMHLMAWAARIGDERPRPWEPNLDGRSAP